MINLVEGTETVETEARSVSDAAAGQLHYW